MVSEKSPSLTACTLAPVHMRLKIGQTGNKCQLENIEPKISPRFYALVMLLTLINQKLNRLYATPHRGMVQCGAAVFACINVNIGKCGATLVDLIVFDAIEQLLERRVALCE